MKHAASSSSRLTPEQIREIETAVLEASEKALDPAFFLLAATLEKVAGRWALGLYVEAREGMITLDDCERISRALEPEIEALPLLEALSYSLEVSSPGLFRPLRTQRELGFYQGREVCIEEQQPPPKAGSKKKRASRPPARLVAKGILESFNLEESRVTLRQGETGQPLELSIGENMEIRLDPEVRLPQDEEGFGDNPGEAPDDCSAVQYQYQNQPNEQEAYAND